MLSELHCAHQYIIYNELHIKKRGNTHELETLINTENKITLAKKFVRVDKAILTTFCNSFSLKLLFSFQYALIHRFL